MKRSLFVALSLFAAACSNPTKESELNGVPGSPVLAPALRLSCVETQTFVDAPGYEHSLSIRQRLQTASVQKRSISMQGYGEWEIGQLPYHVEESFGEDGSMTLSLNEMVDKEVDWSKEGCFKLVPEMSYRLTRDAEGTWKGTAELIGNILINPVALCDVPHIARPPQYEVACTEL